MIDLSDERGRFLRLNYPSRLFISPYSTGFLPNGDLILVSLDNELKGYKIYLYSFKNKPTTDKTLWKYSQVYDIDIPECLKEHNIDCFIYQTKLFLYSGSNLITQMDLLTLTYDKRYLLHNDVKNGPFKIVINKNQTLLALNICGAIDIFSM